MANRYKLEKKKFTNFIKYSIRDVYEGKTLTSLSISSKDIANGSGWIFSSIKSLGELVDKLNIEGREGIEI